MAVEIVAINPSAKGGGKKKGKAMAKKKGKKKGKKKNPSARGAARALATRGRATIGGMNIKSALMGAPPRAAGMMACKWGAKKFPGVEGGGDREDWTFTNYLAGGATGFFAGFVAEMFKKGTGQKVLEGAIDLLVYKLIENEVVPKSEFLTEQFGEDEPYVLLGEDEDVSEGDLLLGDDGEIYMMGEDGYTRPVGEQHRMVAAELARRALEAQRVPRNRQFAGPLEKPGVLGALGGALERPGVLGSADPYPAPRPSDPYAEAYAGRG